MDKGFRVMCYVEEIHYCVSILLVLLTVWILSVTATSVPNSQSLPTVTEGKLAFQSIPTTFIPNVFGKKYVLL